MENNFNEVMSRRTDEELIKIVTIDRDNYQPLAVEAADREIKIRQLDANMIEKVNNDFIAKIEEQRTLDSTIVNSWIRLLHFIVDLFAFLIVGFIFSLLIDFFTFSSNGQIIQLLSILILIVSYFGYYIIMEYAFQKTLGKFITKTKVVKANGQKPELSDIILRTIFRLIPFDRVSFLFTRNGFHDYLSHTTVIKDTK